MEGAGSPFVLFARDQVELLDTWHTVGLRGTGSGDVRVTDAVVPDGRWVHLDRAVPVVATPVSGLPFLGLLAAGVASVALGLARRARHELVTRPAGHRSPTERPAVAAEVARAEAAERAARAFLHGAVDGAADGSLSTDEAGRRLRLAATHATWAAAGAVDRMYRAAGGSAVHEDAPIQRVFRDVHVATQHAMVSDRTFELLGQGSPPGPGGGR